MMRTREIFLMTCVFFCTTGGDAIYAQGRGVGRGLGISANNAAASGALAGRSGLNAAAQSVAGSGGGAKSLGAGRNANSFGQVAGRGSAALPSNLSRLSGAAAGASRTARAVTPPSHAFAGTSPQQAVPGTSASSLSIWERIQQKRISQAEHLRGISERNGNEALLQTADRMEASAFQNFQRQSSTPAEAATRDSELNAAAATANAAAAQPQVSPAKRGFWFRSR